MQHVNTHFSEVRRPAERVQSQWTLALLPLRLSLLLQVSTRQIQAAVNLTRQNIVPHHHFIGAWLSYHYDVLHTHIFKKNTPSFLNKLQEWQILSGLVFNFCKDDYFSSATASFPQYSLRVPLFGEELKQNAVSAQSSGAAEEQVQRSPTHPPRPPRCSRRHCISLFWCERGNAYCIAALQRLPACATVLCSTIPKKKGKGGKRKHLICKRKIYAKPSSTF